MRNIFDLLNIVKELKQTGEYTSIALGRYKYPESVKEAFENFKQELWPQKHT